MADYKAMYHKIFNAATDAIALLQTAQVQTEEMFISQEAPDIIVLDSPDKE